MRSAMRTAHGLRLAAIIALGAFGVHQLRFLIAAAPVQEGHRYLSDLLPGIAVLVLAGVVATLFRGTEASSPVRVSLTRRVLFFAGALLTVFLCQEFLEGLLVSGHPVGPGAILGDGGWLAVPLALAIGALSALLARLLEQVERAIAVVHSRRSRRRRPPAVRGRALSARGRRLAEAPLSFGLARRPPPFVPA